MLEKLMFMFIFEKFGVFPLEKVNAKFSKVNAF